MRVPAILQRKRNIGIASEETVDLNQESTELTHTSFVVTNSLHSVLNSMNHVILVKPMDSSSIGQTSFTIISSDLEDEVCQTKELQSSQSPKLKIDEILLKQDNQDLEVDHSNIFHCESCDESFNDRSALIIHKTEKSIVRTRAALREPVVKYNCDICKRLFTSNGMLARHYRNCGAVELESLLPSVRRRRARNAIEDMPIKNKDNEPSTCNKCGKIFKKDKYLKTHMTLVHSEHLNCQLCEAKLESVQLLKAHMNQVHSGDFTEFCSICNKGFYLRQSLKVHLTAHSRDDNPCVCEVCQKSFRHEVYLRKHVQLVHVEMKDRKKYHCDACGYKTQYKTVFREHVYKHTGEDQVQCGVCGKSMRRSYLKMHLRIHTGEKPEICEYCGKAFTARKYLTKHWVVHTGEKPYQCQICGKSYTQKGTLTLHCRKKHQQPVVLNDELNLEIIEKSDIQIKDNVEEREAAQEDEQLGVNQAVLMDTITNIEEISEEIQTFDDENMIENHEEVIDGEFESNDRTVEYVTGEFEEDVT